MGGKATDILFAELVPNPDMYLVEREDLKKMLSEMQISAAGLTDPKQQAQIGQLTGAKILVTGSVFQVADKLYVVAKLIGTETGRVVGASAKGSVNDPFDGIVEQLSKNVVAELKKSGSQLVPAPQPVGDRVAALLYQLRDNTLHPSVHIAVTERHVGQAVIDPAVETELAKICHEVGLKVGDKNDADVLLIGEGFSQFASKHGEFTSVKARVELKALDAKTGRLLAVDRQTAVAVDLAELIAGKAALQDATVRLTCRLLPTMLKTLGEVNKDGGKKGDEKKDGQ